MKVPFNKKDTTLLKCLKQNKYSTQFQVAQKDVSKQGAPMLLWLNKHNIE